MKLRNLLKEKQESSYIAAKVSYHEYNDKIFASIEYLESGKIYYVLLNGFADFAKLADNLGKKIKTELNHITNYIDINITELGKLSNWMNHFSKISDSELFDKEDDDMNENKYEF